MATNTKPARRLSRRQDPSAKIMKMRDTTHTSCNTCGRDVRAPYRRRDTSGKVIEGCVDAAHTDHVHGAASEWHWRQGAIAIRIDTYKFLAAL